MAVTEEIAHRQMSRPHWHVKGCTCMQCSTAEHKPGCICNDCLDPPIIGISLKPGAVNRWDGTRIHDAPKCECQTCQDIRARYRAALEDDAPTCPKCGGNDYSGHFKPNCKDDPVNHPPHYTAGGIECIDAIKAALTDEEFRGFCKGNALKYVWRERHKGGTESLAKAGWYLERLK